MSAKIVVEWERKSEFPGICFAAAGDALACIPETKSKSVEVIHIRRPDRQHWSDWASHWEFKVVVSLQSLIPHPPNYGLDEDLYSPAKGIIAGVPQRERYLVLSEDQLREETISEYIEAEIEDAYTTVVSQFLEITQSIGKVLKDW
ncbi:hypothetical protein COU17_00440 [Candidatus Kaiserbacteria bacterium CG10_big_fil_rev_8_21_14_0_10_49_17]|uniref:Uncharacterized protein n=1 Tax=Candidatus Kaiserbacteria bacterium CG10_big_fil_rev_8_21_14_0_10_49_17 TaxID=1974609 RepID=A0A2M6WFB1_9BACT|nr:MAG: hypothetical protein COU17_00440 [Candidatus Kaiserbacteria bacterium CG10_big_fil_rev_8_21_14_0_10_49_17]